MCFSNKFVHPNVMYYLFSRINIYITLYVMLVNENKNKHIVLAIGANCHLKRT